MEKLQELVEVKMKLDDNLPYRAALVPQVEDLGLERFVLVDVGHGYRCCFIHSSNVNPDLLFSCLRFMWSGQYDKSFVIE